MALSKIDVSGNIATAFGDWSVLSLPFGMAPYATTATLIDSGNGWKIVSLCVGAGAS
jgi:hypothetical protein